MYIFLPRVCSTQSVFFYHSLQNSYLHPIPFVLIFVFFKMVPFLWSELVGYIISKGCHIKVQYIRSLVMNKMHYSIILATKKIKAKIAAVCFLWRALGGIFPPYCFYNFWCCSIVMDIPCLNLHPYSHCFWYLIINFYQILSKVSDIKDNRWSNAGISSSVWRHMYYINSSVWR